MKYRSLTKSELAKAAGVSRWTLARWLKKEPMRQMLEPFHLHPKQQRLPRKAVKIICEYYVIEID